MQPLVFAHVLTCIQMAFQTLATVLTYDPLLHLLLNIVTYLGITDLTDKPLDKSKLLLESIFIKLPNDEVDF